jgi:hypothetical protein
MPTMVYIVYTTVPVVKMSYPEIYETFLAYIPSHVTHILNRNVLVKGYGDNYIVH